jgi:uncharacterized protein YbjT (DUF2867 family)
MKVLVTGATGNVGSHVVRALRKHGLEARAFVRDGDKAVRMLGEYVQLAVGDFADQSSLERALSGTDAMFLACGNHPGQVEHECAAIDAARAAGVRRVVKLSGPSAAVDSPLLFERWHGEIERHLIGSGVPYVMLRPSAYMTNLLGSAEAIKHTGKLFAPAGSARIAYIDPYDVAAVAAATLATHWHTGMTYTLTGPRAITYTQIAQDLSAAVGREIQYVEVPDEAARQNMLEAGLPPMVADTIVEVFASYRAGAQTRTTDTVRALTAHEPRSFAQFAREHAAAFGATTVGGRV